MLLSGNGVTDVAQAVGVARQTVHTWKARLDKGGLDALRAMGEKGRPPKLSNSQVGRLRRTLRTSPSEHGYETKLWTINQVQQIIKSQFDTEFSVAQTWRIMNSLRP
jgi:transposase